MAAFAGVESDQMGFRAIRLRFELEPSLNGEALETLLALTERYCFVYQTVARGVPVTISHTSNQQSQ